MAEAAVGPQSHKHDLTWMTYPNYETTEAGDNIEPPGAIDLVRPVLTHNYETLRQRCIELTGNRGIARAEQAAYKEAFKKANDAEREYLKEGFEAGYDSLLRHQAETADLLDKANECQAFSQKFFDYLKAKEASRQRTITDPNSEASDVEKATSQKERIVKCLPFVSAGLLTLGARIPFIEKYLKEQKAALENFTPQLSYRERFNQWWSRSREVSEDLEEAASGEQSVEGSDGGGEDTEIGPQLPAEGLPAASSDVSADVDAGAVENEAARITAEIKDAEERAKTAEAAALAAQATVDANKASAEVAELNARKAMAMEIAAKAEEKLEALRSELKKLQQRQQKARILARKSRGEANKAKKAAGGGTSTEKMKR